MLDSCTLLDNKLSGLLVRGGATPAVSHCQLSGNGEWGLLLVDAGGSYAANQITGNAKGSVAYSMLYEEVDTARMVVDNKLDRRVTSLATTR